MPEPDDTYTSSVNARMAAHVGEEPQHPDDLEREGRHGEPPVPGAQWDELHRRWERWDDASQQWVVVGEEHGDDVEPADENPIPPLLARELLRSEDLEEEHPPVSDVERAPEPGSGPKGAQWNEVTQRWERWDESAGDWVEAAD